jgi:Alpha amylase, catalytic domain/Alpha amylase, C-terminal all-beta domain
MDAIPTLKSLGYSHIHVSPPQESNEFVWQLWGRYQPVDHSTIAGPLGTEAEFEEMNEVADAHDIQIVVDTVFNHTVDDRGLVSDREKFGIGWTESSEGGVLDRTDVELAYAFIFGREDGLPYVFVDMNTIDAKDDPFDDPAIVSGIRFHNLCLAGHGGVDRRSEIWRIETPNAIAFQRGDDRLVVINKAGEVFPIRHLETSLEPGTYKEVRRGWLMQVQPDGKVIHWDVPGRSAMMFVRVGG